MLGNYLLFASIDRRQAEAKCIFFNTSVSLDTGRGPGTVPAVLTSKALVTHCFQHTAHLICLCMDDELHQSPLLAP